MQYWLMKSEPDEFSIDDLKKAGKRGSHWDGVRNYQVRNMMRDEMRKNDLAFFYHSSCAVPGIAGVMKISAEAYPDFTAFDPDDPHFDPKSDPETPRWYMVDVTFQEKFKRVITLNELRGKSKLASMRVLKRGNRLSITPVTKAEWNVIIAMAKQL
ncbi:MAG: EVE domain-containing protein [Gammaproteobacteria bacterium]|nr:EVE domain-containing protein [Gammaproteobacteria bacterium]